MRIHLDCDLSNLHRDLLGQASAVEKAVVDAIHALQEGNATLAKQVIASEDECLKIIALHQPVATDLRRIAAILKINADLERMADLATEICQRALRLTELKPIGMPIRLQQMADLTTSAMSMSVESFIEMNTQLARRACRMDDQIDEANCEIIRDLIEMMKKMPELIEPALSLFSATRHLERIADHATNIAEDVIYIAEGRIVRHHPELLAVASTEPHGNS
jgi:phosphate transport system protein